MARPAPDRPDRPAPPAHRRPRRIVAGLLLVLGVVLMLLAPGSPGGALVLLLGVGIELVGLILERRA